MQFDVKERFILARELNSFKGRFEAWLVSNDLKREFGFSAEELSVLKFRQEGDHVFWEEAKVDPKEVEIKLGALDSVLLPMFVRISEAGNIMEELGLIYKRLLQAKHELTPKLHEAGAPGA